MMGGNIRLKPKEQVDFDLKMSAFDEAEDATTWQQNAASKVVNNVIDLDDKKSSYSRTSYAIEAGYFYLEENNKR